MLPPAPQTGAAAKFLNIASDSAIAHDTLVPTARCFREVIQWQALQGDRRREDGEGRRDLDRMRQKTGEGHEGNDEGWMSRTERKR